jgi:probable rRNA maturation factor
MTMPRLQDDSGSAAAPTEDPDPTRSLLVDYVSEAGDWTTIGDIEAVLAPVLAAVGVRADLLAFMPAEACVAFTDDSAMRRLNGHFRGQDKPTNVLSFPSGLPVVAGERRNLGDIVFGCETVLREAAEQGVAAADHLRHLMLHGLLHLMGYDHETDGDADVMEALEIAILADLGIANPYEEAADAPAAR